jgi:hypothetical protein
MFFQPRLGICGFFRFNLLTITVQYPNIFNSFQFGLKGFGRHVGPVPTNASDPRCLCTLTRGEEKYILVIVCKHSIAVRHSFHTIYIYIYQYITIYYN